MAWYWITLIVLGYLLIGIAAERITKKIKVVNVILDLDYLNHFLVETAL